jgi:hypothetical protein
MNLNVTVADLLKLAPAPSVPTKLVVSMKPDGSATACVDGVKPDGIETLTTVTLDKSE